MVNTSTKLNAIAYPSAFGGEESILLLHGLGSCAQDWSLQAPILAEKGPVYALDLPGHGDSPALPGWPRMEAYARSVADWMSVEGVEHAHLVGLSLGGLVALQLALDQASSIRSLTIVNAFGRLHVSPLGAFHSAGRVLLLLSGRMEWLGAWVARALFPEPEQNALRELAAARIAANPRRAYLQAVGAIARFEVLGRLDQLRVPVLIIAGEQDLIVPMDAKRELAESIPGAEFVTIAESGHVTPVDAAGRFNAILFEFLAGIT